MNPTHAEAVASAAADEARTGGHMSDALKLARAIIDDTRVGDSSTYYSCMLVLARAVIAQSDVLAKLRAEVSDVRSKLYALEAQHHAEDRPVRTELRLAKAERDELRAEVAAYECEIDRIAHGNTIESDAMCVNEVEVCNLRGDNAKLRAAMGEALDIASELRCPGPFDDAALARIVELRRLADGE